MRRPYFESARDVYYRAACELYQLAAAADPETADAPSFFARAQKMANEAHEMWPLSARQENRMYRLKRAAAVTAGRRAA